MDKIEVELKTLFNKKNKEIKERTTKQLQLSAGKEKQNESDNKRELKAYGEEKSPKDINGQK